MSGFNVIDLSKLPPPKVIEELSFESIFQEFLADFLKKNPSYEALLESDPAIILLQVMAYRELLVRARINDAAKSTMLAYAKGSDLDQLVADFNISRLDGESDDRLRLRRQLALEGVSTAGPIGAYIFHALSASTKVKSVAVKSEVAGEVLVTILSNDFDGTADDELIDIVKNKLNDEDIRPLTDKVIIQNANIIKYKIEAIMIVYPGPSFEVVENMARANLEKYVYDRHFIEEIVAISGIYDALHIDGVKKIELITPQNDIITSDVEAAYCEEIVIRMRTQNE